MRALLRMAMLGLVVAGGHAYCQVTAETAGASTEPSGEPDLRATTETALMDAIGMGEIDRAHAILQGARSRGLPLGVYHLLAARICAARHDATGEEENLRGAVYRDPGLTEAYMRLAAIMEGRGLWLDAVEFYNKAIESAPERAEAYLELARIYFEHERHRTGIGVLLRARAAVPADTGVLIALARAYRRIGDRASAIEQYKVAAELTEGAERADCNVQIGDLCLELDDLSGAFCYYRLAIEGGLEPTAPLYRRIAGVTDSLAQKGAERAWDALESYVGGKAEAMEREDVYGAVSAALHGERQVVGLMDTVRAPADLTAENSQRQFYYSLLCEVLTNGLSYLDTGNEQFVQDGRDRRREAGAMLDALRPAR